MLLERLESKCIEISSKAWPQSIFNLPLFRVMSYEFSKDLAFIFLNGAYFQEYLGKWISLSLWPENGSKFAENSIAKRSLS